MSNVLIHDAGFAAEDFTREIMHWEKALSPVHYGKQGYGLDVPNTISAQDLLPHFDTVGLIRIPFPNFADGRGFSTARHLRLLGFWGRLRAHGHIIADQYTMVRRCGFDEVEIDQYLAARQPVDDWKFRANWRSHSYLNRLQKAG